MDSHSGQEHDATPTTSEGNVYWFIRDRHWSRAGLGIACLLLFMSPILRRRLTRAEFLVYLQLPMYMLHQYEEHIHGAFKRDVNRGRLPLPRGENLTHWKIFWINILGVWGFDTGLLYLARFTDPTIGLAAPYLAMINGILHIGPTLKWRRYNPGLWTSLLLFLPFGGYSVYTISLRSGATLRAHLRGIGVAVLAHVLAVLFVVVGGRR